MEQHQCRNSVSQGKPRRARNQLFVVKLLLLFIFFALNSKASVVDQGDTTKSKYELNDPRNPNCPCHKYQKQAEEEYRQLLAAQGKLQPGITSKNGGDENNLRSVSDRSSIKFRHSKIRKHKRRKGGRHHGRERKQRKSWSCVHFG